MSEQNTAVMAKRIWGIVKVMYFMLRKGISSKRKILLDLNMFMKRGKLASKAAITNLIASSATFRRTNSSNSNSGEYEFSCSNTPARPHHHSHVSSLFGVCANAPPTLDDDAAVTETAVRAALEIMEYSASPIPAAAMVRQLRITDSPFPLREADTVDSRPVDEAAEAFIRRFYKDLSRQTHSE